MTYAELKSRFPSACESFLLFNASDRQPKPITSSKVKTLSSGLSAQKKGILEKIVITGQIRGGKNAILVTRSGARVPKASWAKWRNEKVNEVKAQLPQGWTPIDTFANIELTYVAGDKRRRDMPAIVDSIYHVLEKAGFCTDDTFLWVSRSSRSHDKENPRAEIKIC